MTEENNSLDNFLEHHGVKGMHWGQHAKSVGSGLVKSVAEGAKAAANAADDKDARINAARENAPKARAEYKQAKLDYKVDKAKYREEKAKVGRAQAKATLNREGKTKLSEARTKYINNNRIANQETSQEAVQRMVREILAPPPAPSAYSQLQNNRRAGYTYGQR